jgi:hypothetical protein
MDMEGALRARLLAAVPRVYWDERPQDSVLPDVTLLLAADSRDQHMEGFQELQPARVQADVRGRSFAEKKTLKEAVIAILGIPHTGNGISFSAATEIMAHTANERTETQFIFRDIIDFTIHHAPAQ